MAGGHLRNGDDLYVVFQNKSFFLQEHYFGKNKVIDHIRILGIGLELACNGGSCAGISLKRD